MAVSEDGEPDSQGPDRLDGQAGVSLTQHPERAGARRRQALRERERRLLERERRLLEQERRLLEQGSHAYDWVRATAAGTFWSKLNAIDFMNSSLQFAALAVLCLFPFLITVSAESGGMRDTPSSPASVSIRMRPETSTSSCPQDITQ